MAKIFWVQCPECEGKFYCHTDDLWNTQWELLCPYCHNTFRQEESLMIARSEHGADYD